MSRNNRIGMLARSRVGARPGARTRTARLKLNQSRRPCPPRVEQLEDRVTPSILGTFELDGNTTTGVLGTSGSTTTSHDWDQIFADAGSPTTKGSFTKGASSAALAG